jgi:hypothetical protein
MSLVPPPPMATSTFVQYREITQIIDIDTLRTENVRRWWPFMRDRRINATLLTPIDRSHIVFRKVKNILSIVFFVKRK